MTPNRKTLDNMGVRTRPRTYDMSYLKPSAPRKIVQDILPAKRLVVANDDESKLQQSAIEKSKQLLAPIKVDDIQQDSSQTARASQQRQMPSMRPASLKPVVEDAVPTSIVDMVTAIQTAPDGMNTAPQIDSMDSINSRISLGTIVKNMFDDRKSIIISAMSMLLMIGGVVALLGSFTTNKIVGEQIQALSEVASASVDNESLASDEGIPSEDPVPDSVIAAYTSPLDEPRYISIPNLRINKTRVLGMGLDNQGAIKTPRTTWDTGWFNGSSKPGDKVGASLIVGHVSGLTSGGVFYNLYRLNDGDEILIEMGDGTIYTYRVVSKEEVPLEGINMNNYLVSKNIDKPGLTLMTCAGEYNPITQTYDNRLAVFAVREP